MISMKTFEDTFKISQAGDHSLQNNQRDEKEVPL